MLFLIIKTVVFTAALTISSFVLFDNYHSDKSVGDKFLDCFFASSAWALFYVLTNF